MVVRHGHWGIRCTIRSAYELLFALRFLFSRFIPFRVIASFSSVHPFLYIHIQLRFHSESDQIDMGVFLARGKGPQYASRRPLFGLPPSGGIAQPPLQIPSVYMGPWAWFVMRRIKHQLLFINLKRARNKLDMTKLALLLACTTILARIIL